MKKNKVKIFISCLLLMGLTVFVFSRFKLSKQKIPEHTVNFYQIKSTKQFKGYLNPSLTFWYNAEFNKEVLWRIDTDSVVKKGDPVLKFQITDLEEEIEGHTAGIVDKEATLAGIVLQNESELNKAKLETKEMALRVEMSKYNYELAKNDPSDLVKEQLDMLLKRDFAKKSFLESKFKINEFLFNKGLISDSALQTSKVNLIRAESDYLRTSLLCKDRLVGVNPVRLKRLEKQLELAELNYQDSIVNEKNLEEINRSKEVSVKEDIFTIKNKVDRFKSQLERSTVVAPFDGKVYFPGIYKGSMTSEPIEIGETPIKGVGLLFFTNSSDFDVEFQVTESDLIQISKGTKISFELKSNQSIKVTGEIYKLSEIASDKNIILGDLALEKKGEANIRVIQVFAKLNKTHSEFRQGITGTVSIELLGKECLAIPSKSIKLINNKCFVITKKNEKKEIVLGKSDGFMVEVLSGLNQGEIILND